MQPCNCPSTGCANCSSDNTPSFWSALASAASALGTAAGVISALLTFAKLIIAGTLTIGVGIILAGVAAVLVVLGVIITRGVDSCTQGGDDRVNFCIAGVVNSVSPSFNSASDQIFPFSATQNEIDVVSKSKYWNIIQKSNAFVWCNTDIVQNSDTDNSEIIRVYFYTPAVCNAVIGAAVGAAVVGAAAVVVVAVAAGIIGVGCATFFGCLLALIIAAIIVAVAALLGAFAGGQIAKAASGSTSGTSAGNVGSIAAGDLITCTGPLQIRGDDNGANVFWWCNSFSLSGTISTPAPFRYCDVDSQFPMDGC